MPTDRLLSTSELRQAVAASRQTEARDTTTEKILAFSIITGFIAGIAIIGDSIRRWFKPQATHKRGTQKASIKATQSIHAACEHGCVH